MYVQLQGIAYRLKQCVCTCPLRVNLRGIFLYRLKLFVYLCTLERVNFLGKQANTVCWYLCTSYRVKFQGMQAKTVCTCAFHRGLINSGATDHLSSFSQ